MHPNEVKTDWYQTEASVHIALYVKGLTHDKVSVQAEESTVQVKIDSPETLTPLLFQLANPIKPGQVSIHVTPTCCELSLIKNTQGLRWVSLESVTEDSSSTRAPDPGRFLLDSSQDTGLDSTADSSIIEFFQNLYQRSPDDVKRAMNKSFFESNGTALSTDWSEVKKKTIQPHPPGEA